MGTLVEMAGVLCCLLADYCALIKLPIPEVVPAGNIPKVISQNEQSPELCAPISYSDGPEEFAAQ